ncbi:MAG: M15 family metallopeptidase [Succinivibrionaceae bacterium]|nr:M15 family metallopeptidase [Succinivibrionaceae bacterium]
MASSDWRRYAGLDDTALVPFAAGSALRGLPAAIEALHGLFEEALADGITLGIASAYRDFGRQFRIFDDKFAGRRPVLDEREQPLNALALPPRERVGAICRFSAVPGFSRHHFGSDFDLFSPSMLPEGQSLELTAREYEPGSYFHALGLWFDDHLARHGFYRPFSGKGGIGLEPWHVSHAASARECLGRFDFEKAASYLEETAAPWAAEAVRYLRAHPGCFGDPSQ